LAELSTQLDSQAAEVMLKEKRAMKLRKRIGRYKKKEVAEQLKGGKVVQVIWSTQIRVVPDSLRDKILVGSDVLLLDVPVAATTESQKRACRLDSS
jgi:hypothetical protein